MPSLVLVYIPPASFLHTSANCSMNCDKMMTGLDHPGAQDEENMKKATKRYITTFKNCIFIASWSIANFMAET